MKTLRSLIKSRPELYLAARRVVMWFRRHRYQLRFVHPTAYMAAGSWLPRDLIAHEYTYVGPDCMFGPGVQLAAYAMVGPRVSIVGGDHVYDRPGVPILFSGRPSMRSTIIEADAWICCGAILIAGVRIGRGAIVAAGAVVTKDVPPYEIHAGVPARKIGMRFAKQTDRMLHDAMLGRAPVEGEYCHDQEEQNLAHAMKD